MKTTREEFLKDVRCVLNESQEWTREVLTRIGWTQEHLLQKDEDLSVCPHEPTHRVPASRLERHAADCYLFMQGYTPEQVEKMREPDHFCDKSTLVETVHIDDETFSQILESVSGCKHRPVPLTVERMTTDLRREERLAIYQYCITKAKAAAKPTSLPEASLMLLEEEKAEEQAGLTVPQQRAFERDCKRRRATYRGKSTHTNKKSHLEILKDVIDNQMDLLIRNRLSDVKDVKETDDVRESCDVTQNTNSPTSRLSDRVDYHQPQAVQRSRSRSPRQQRSRSHYSSTRRRSRSPLLDRIRSSRTSVDRDNNPMWLNADRLIKEEDTGSEKRHKHKKQKKHKHRRKHRRSRSQERSRSRERERSIPKETPIKEEKT